MAFGSDVNVKSVSLPLPRVDHALFIVLLCRHFAVSSSLSVLWLVTQLLAWWQETACRDSSYDPAAASCGGTPLGSDLFNKALN
jgi:hypothetical protein